MSLPSRSVPFLNISLKLGHTVLLRLDGSSIEQIKGGRDDLEEVCQGSAWSEHVWCGMVTGSAYTDTCSPLSKAQRRGQQGDLRGSLYLPVVLTDFRVNDGAVQGVDDPQPLFDRSSQLFGPDILNGTRDVGLELELVDHVAKIVVVLVLEVGHQILHVHVVGLEGSSVAEVQVANDLFPLDRQRDTDIPVRKHELTLLTRIRPCIWHPSVFCSAIFSVQPSLTHCKG